MKVLFITDNFPPELNAPATRTYEHCKLWAARGVDVTVITGAPNFPQGKVYDGYRNSLFNIEHMDGIRVVRVWTYMAPNSGFVRRIADYTSFAATSFFAGLFIKSDVIIATSPQFFTTFSAAALSALKRKPWIFELRDIWPESIAAVGAAKNRKLLRALEKIELTLYRSASRVVAVTKAFKENLVSRGVSADHIEVVTNGADLSRFSPQEKDMKLQDSLNLSGKTVFGYIGTHGMAHGLDFIVGAIAKLKNEPYHFLFIGDGAEKARVMALAQEKGLTNATFLDPIAKHEVPRYLAQIDVALVPLRPSETFKTVIPSKIFEAAAMGKPILLGVDGHAREILEEYGAGVFFIPGDEEDFLAKVRLIAADPELYKNLQEGALRLARQYDRQTLAENMLQVIRAVARSPYNTWG